MRRRLFSVVSAFSLLLCIATLGLCIFTYFMSANKQYRVFRGDGIDGGVRGAFGVNS
jgi:hypothetical protein